MTRRRQNRPLYCQALPQVDPVSAVRGVSELSGKLSCMGARWGTAKRPRFSRSANFACPKKRTHSSTGLRSALRPNHGRSRLQTLCLKAAIYCGSFNACGRIPDFRMDGTDAGAPKLVWTRLMLAFPLVLVTAAALQDLDHIIRQWISTNLLFHLPNHLRVIP